MELTTTQKKAVDQLRENVKDIALPHFNDRFFSRWLMARDWDVKKAEKMIRDNKAWRKEIGADTILDWEPPAVLLKYYPGGYFGVDKEGFPIWFEILAYADSRGFAYSTSHRDFMKFKVYWTEYLYQKGYPELSKQYGKVIDECNIILDFDGLTVKHFWKPAIDSILDVLTTIDNNYPCGLRTCYIINAPTIVSLVWSIAKPFVSEYNRSKLRLLGSNWKTQLLTYIDADQLPVHWGGTARDPDGDPRCRSKICLGGPIPEEYHLMKNFRETIDMSKFIVETVQRGSSLQIDFDVAIVNSLLSWNFFTDDKDIGFGVFRRTADKRQRADDMEEVTPSERVNSHIIPVSGSIQCDKKGTYVLRFDNTYSWVNSKKITYLVEVVPPVNQEELEQAMMETHL